MGTMCAQRMWLDQVSLQSEDARPQDLSCAAFSQFPTASPTSPNQHYPPVNMFPVLFYYLAVLRDRIRYHEPPEPSDIALKGELIISSVGLS